MTSKKFLIYKVTNLINNKIYIGQTNNFKKRKIEHEKCYKKDDCYFHRALECYGKQNFKWEIIEKNLTKKEADEKERKYIKYFKSYYRYKHSKGYNMTKGGEGGNPWNAKEVIVFDNDFNVIQTFMDCTECSKFINSHPSNIASACRRLGTCNGYIVRYKEDYKKYGKYITKRYKGEKKVVQLSKKGKYINTFNSLIEASILTNTRRTGISGCLRGDYKLSNGYMWVYHDKYNSDNIQAISDTYGKKINKIVQLSLDNKYINTFNNCVEACKYVGGKSYKFINKVLSHKNRTAYGYKWVKYEDYIKDNTEVIK